MANVTCIDVSTFQQNIDFKKVKAAGIIAVIIRAGYGRETSQKDTQFETHYKNAKAAGLKIGAYWYSYADSVADAQKEATACLACIKGKTFDMPVYIDMEDSSQTKYGKTALTAMAKAFCEAIKAGGYRAGVYANLNWFTNYLDYATLKKSYSIWLAQYASKNDKDCDIWQNSSTGKIDGISGNVDTNVIYNSSVIGNLNNKEEEEMIEYGLTNNATWSYKQHLRILRVMGVITQTVDNNGTFGDGTLKATQQVQKAAGITVDGIVGPDTINAVYTLESKAFNAQSTKIANAKKALA